MKPWKTLSTSMIEENSHLCFKVDDIETPEGVAGRYFYHEIQHGAVALVGQLASDQFVFVREYRYLTGKVGIAHIGGAIEEGETPERAAGREFEEETGYRASELVHLGGQFTAPSFSKEYVEVFLARGLKKTRQRLEAYEQVEPVVLSRAQVEAAIIQGNIVDGITITAWYRVRAFLEASA